MLPRAFATSPIHPAPRRAHPCRPVFLPTCARLFFFLCALSLSSLIAVRRRGTAARIVLAAASLSLLCLFSLSRPPLWSLLLLWTTLPLLRPKLNFPGTWYLSNLIAILVSTHDIFDVARFSKSFFKISYFSCICVSFCMLRKNFFLLQSTSFIMKGARRCADINPIAIKP